MKRNKIIFWVTTGLVAAGMLMSGSMYLTHNPKIVDGFKQLGYPDYFMYILGTAKILGAIALLQPISSKLREWAYAGFTFIMISAVWTHLAANAPGVISPIIFMAILGVSYYFNIAISKANK